jgi:hypothetical protein
MSTRASTPLFERIRFRSTARSAAALLFCSLLLTGCIEVEKQWRIGIETVCLLIHVSDLPAGKQAVITIKATGGGLAPGQTSFTGGNGYYKVCMPIPGSMPAETSPLTVTVWAADPASPNNQQKVAAPVDGHVSDLPTVPPTLPPGTVTKP